MTTKARLTIGLAGILATALPLCAGDWAQFRGPSGDGTTGEAEIPLQWGREKNIKWRTALPTPANSSPIVSRGRVFLTCADDRGRKRSLFCFDRRDGKQLWQRTVDFDEVMPTHKTNPYCGSTPVADGERVVVWHGSAGLYCYDFDGRQLWAVGLGEFRHMWGYASSPIIHDGKVILHCGPGKRVFLTALDLQTGRSVWETDEPVKGDGQRNEKKHYVGSWSTPVIRKIDGRDQIVCAMTTRVNGYDPATGELIWSCDGLSGWRGELAYSSPVFAGDICVQVGGFGGPSMGFRAGGRGNITEQARLWRVEKNPQSIGSGVFANGHLFIPDAADGAIRCLDPRTGEEQWRRKAAAPAYWGSIVMAAGRLLVTNQEGETTVFAPNPEEYEELARNDLAEASNATPAISDGEIFIRTAAALYCIAEDK
jgi:outer membrane protein assembly factor BamB